MAMKIVLATVISWITGVDLGMCVGASDAGAPFLPLTWLSAVILNLCAVIVVFFAVKERR